MPKLEEIYEWIENEYGTPLVVYPQGYGAQQLEVNEGAIDCYWVIIENGNEREIRWIIGGVKDISEGEGPASLDCPLWFFELVPTANRIWRENVAEFWAQQDK